MLVTRLGLAAALLLVSPALLLAQPMEPPRPHRIGKTTLTGLVAIGPEGVSVEGVRIVDGPLLPILRELGGRYVSLKGTIAKGDPDDSMTVASVKGKNSAARPVDVLQGPEDGASAMTQVDPGRGMDVTGRSRNGAWLKVKIAEDGGYSEDGWVKKGELELASKSYDGPNPKRTLAGVVAVVGSAVTVNGVRVKNEPFAKILAKAKGRTVTLEGVVTKSGAGEVVTVATVSALNASARPRNVKVLERAEERAPQLGAPVAAGTSVEITGMTPDGVWFTTIVAEGDMREKGFVKVSDLTIGTPIAPARPATTTGVNGALDRP